jgi:hypothetical protein
MSARTRPWSSDTFATEVRRQFGPSAARWGLADPVEDNAFLPSIEYTGARLTYDWILDPQDAAVSVAVRLIVAGGILHAWVEDIIVGAELGVRQDVRSSARTWRAMQSAIESHVQWLTRLHPLLSGPGAEEFLEQAGARKAIPDLDRDRPIS